LKVLYFLYLAQNPTSTATPIPRGEQGAIGISWLTEEVHVSIGIEYSEMKTNKSSEMKINFLGK
jgi:hypothetical protein